MSPDLPEDPPPSIPHIPYLPDPPEFRTVRDDYRPRPGAPIPGHHKRTENLSAVLDEPRPTRPAPVVLDEEQNGPEPFYPNQGGPHPAPAHEVIEAVPGNSPPDFPPHVDYQQPQQPSHAGVPPQTGPPEDVQVPEEITPSTPDFPRGDYHQPQGLSPQVDGDSSSPCPSAAEEGSNWPGINRRDHIVPSKFNVRGLATAKRNASEPEVVQLSMPNRFKTPNYPTLPLDGTPPTVHSGDFGGVRAEDIHKYLDKSASEPGVAKRSLPEPPSHPCLPPDSIRSPTVLSGDPSDTENHVDEPIPSQSTAPDAAQPSSVRPADFCGVQPKDIRDHIEQNGPYHIEIPNNSTNESEAVATPTPQPLSAKDGGPIDVLKDGFVGSKRVKREEKGVSAPKKKQADESTKGKKHADKSTKGKKHDSDPCKEKESERCLFFLFGRCLQRGVLNNPKGTKVICTFRVLGYCWEWKYVKDPCSTE